MIAPLQTDERHWLSLGPACQMLDVNEATLRRWADRGLVQSYRTPGGHRRFSQADIRALMEQTRSLAGGSETRGGTDAALQHIRRRLHSRSMSHQGWHERIQEESRGRLRLFGRSLLALATDYQSRPGRRVELLAEARLVGEEYGTEMQRLGLSLEDAVGAFVFFRNSFAESLRDAGTSDASPRDVYRTWQQVNAITDEVLQGIVRAHREICTSPVADQSR